MPLYTPDADVGLSAAALALPPALLTTHVVQAEAVLGFRGTTYEGDDATLAKRAVALQVNHQLRTEGRADVVQESKGRQSVTYAKHLGRRVSIDPTALEIAEQLRGHLPPTSGSVENTVVL